MTALADATDPRFTDAQRATLERFERAETPRESYAITVERVARAMMDCDAADGGWSWDDGEPTPHSGIRDAYRRLARAALAAATTEAES